jgi:pyruvate/2-oxoglutarate dehydrogenase complex dihydrolipoamide acyltransferase (E2) component
MARSETTGVYVPTLGESVTEATIGRWFKKPGDTVLVDEPLVELETDKVTIEVPAPSAGTLGEIVAKDGEQVAVGALLGQISDSAVKPDVPTSKAQPVHKANVELLDLAALNAAFVAAAEMERVAALARSSVGQSSLPEFEVQLTVGNDPEPRPPEVEASDEQQITEDEWQQIKDQALALVVAASLDSPSNHLAYVRERIRSALEDVGS